jgi:hypothetical protein
MTILEQISKLKLEIKKVEEDEAASYAAANKTEYGSKEWMDKWDDNRRDKETVDSLYGELDDLYEKYENEIVDADPGVYYESSAGSEFGCRCCIYKLESDHLVIIDDTGHDNLAGNSLAADLSGLTLDEARSFVKARNSESDEINSGKQPDGSHSFYWNIRFGETRKIPRKCLQTESIDAI